MLVQRLVFIGSVAKKKKKKKKKETEVYLY